MYIPNAIPVHVHINIKHSHGSNYAHLSIYHLKSDKIIEQSKTCNT